MLHDFKDFKGKLMLAENRCRHLEASVEKIRVVAKTVVEDVTGESGFDISDDLLENDDDKPEEVSV